MGLGSSIADAALQDTEWTAERALSSMADSAWYGLGAGTVVGGAGAILGAAGKRAVARMGEGSSFKEAVTDFAEKRAAKSLIGQNKRLYNEITDFGENPERLNRIGRKLLDTKVPLTDLDAGLGAISKQADDAVVRMKSVASELDTAGVKVDAKKILQSVDEQIADLRTVDLQYPSGLPRS